MTLADRFRELWAEREWAGPGDTVVVAVSGGLDSMVLLHLLRFALPGGPRWVLVAHFDHGMRPDSAADVHWLRGLCRVWGLTLVSERAAEPPTSEAGARRMRYEFLEGVREGMGARAVLTAHHADDQAETVLHRLLRGTGPDGLAGIAEEREPLVVRPLLSFRREELVAYAGTVGLGWRVDPTNAEVDFTRNWIRHDLLPAVTARMGDGPTRSLIRLAGLAREDAQAWESVLDRLESRVLREGAGTAGEVVLGRDALLALHPGVRARLLRRLLGRWGAALTEAQTAHLLDFAENAQSGSELKDLRGVAVARAFDTLVLRAAADGATDRLTIAGGEGSGVLLLQGRAFQVAWGRHLSAPCGWVERFGAGDLALPGTLREWRPGDRMTLDYGTKKLKKLFGEARVPAPDRTRRPVFVDATDRVLWVPGVARSALARPAESEESNEFFTIAVQEEQE